MRSTAISVYRSPELDKNEDRGPKAAVFIFKMLNASWR